MTLEYDILNNYIDAFTKAKLINEIALIYAYQKNPSALKQSRM
jgi:hypothetical protein